MNEFSYLKNAPKDQVNMKQINQYKKVLRELKQQQERIEMLKRPPYDWSWLWDGVSNWWNSPGYLW